MSFVEMSRLCRVNLYNYVVQPGMSRAAAGSAQLDLLAATEHYLMEACQLPLGVIGSSRKQYTRALPATTTTTTSV